MILLTLGYTFSDHYVLARFVLDQIIWIKGKTDRLTQMITVMHLCGNKSYKPYICWKFCLDRYIRIFPGIQQNLIIRRKWFGYNVNIGERVEQINI